MSMNLRLEVNGRKVELWQTPTMITRMLLVDKEGRVDMRSGKKARRALQGYIIWVERSADGAWKEDELEALNNLRERMVDEVKRIKDILALPDAHLEVYAL